MIPACLPFVAALGFGCAGVSEAVDDAATVEVGAESLRAVEIERSMTLEPTRIPDCLDFNATLESTNTTVALSKLPNGCSLTVAQPGLVLLDEQAVERAREKAGNFDVDGIRGASLEVQRFELTQADGSQLDLSRYIDAVTVIVDGNALLDRLTMTELQTPPVRRELPEPLLEKLKTALKANQAASADVEISLWLRTDGLAELPDALNIHVVMQPELEVNVVDAVF